MTSKWHISVCTREFIEIELKSCMDDNNVLYHCIIISSNHNSLTHLLTPDIENIGDPLALTASYVRHIKWSHAFKNINFSGG